MSKEDSAGDAVVPEAPVADDGEENNSDDGDEESAGSQEQNGTPNGTNDENVQPSSSPSAQQENLPSGAIPSLGLIVQEVGDDGESIGGSQQSDSDVDQFITNSQCSVSSSLSMYQPSLPSRSPHPLRDYETNQTLDCLSTPWLNSNMCSQEFANNTERGDP